MIQLTLTLKMTTAHVVETSVTVNYNSPIQDYVHLDDHTQPTYEMTSGFKILTVFILCCSNSSRASPLKDNTRSRIVLIKKINWRDTTQFDSEDNYRTGFSKCQSLSTTTVLFRATFSRLAMMFILKHSKSTWRQLTILWKLQNQNIKSSGHNACSALLYHWNVQERSIYDNCCFHIESFRASRLITKVSTHEWHICISQTTQ